MRAFVHAWSASTSIAQVATRALYKSVHLFRYDVASRFGVDVIMYLKVTSSDECGMFNASKN